MFFTTIFSYETRLLRNYCTFNICRLKSLADNCPSNRYLNMSSQKSITSLFKPVSLSQMDRKDSQVDSKVKDRSKKEEFIFFFGSTAVFSQFHKVDFEVNGEQYCCMEQYMHHQKAVTFKDHKTATAIMQATDPKEHKHLGRQVSPFDKAIWGTKSVQVVREGNIEKFGQNKELREIMFSTYPKTLVESSPRDRLWGIGMGRNNPKSLDRSQWRGKNLLGETLTEVRGILMKKFNIKPEIAAQMPELDICIPPKKSTQTTKATPTKDMPTKSTPTKDTPTKATPMKDVPTKATPMTDTTSKAGKDSLVDSKVKDPSKKEEFIFFFGSTAVFSQLHKVGFEVNGEQYCCMEQYMNYQKAVTFKDHKTATAIMQATDPKVHEKLGKQVSPFDKVVWDTKSVQVVREGNIEKFSQNEELRKIMFSTYPKTLVKTSPWDRLWGIGMARNNPKALDRSQWRGKNLLGETLTEVRGILMKKFNIKPEIAAQMPELDICIQSPTNWFFTKTTKATPSKDTPTKATPTKDTPTKDKPAKETPTKDKPTKATPTKDKPTKETPTKEDVDKSTVKTERTPNKDKPTPKAKSSSTKKRKHQSDNEEEILAKKQKSDDKNN